MEEDKELTRAIEELLYFMELDPPEDREIELALWLLRLTLESIDLDRV